MSQLAIKGHTTRGKKVIEILEMLGGQYYSHYLLVTTEYNYYYIGNNSTIRCFSKEQLNDSFITFTLEEFIEKFPYKVGDKVKYINNIFDIKSLQWDNEKNTVIYYIDADWSAGYVVEADNLQPYKEETMEEIKIDIPKGYEFTKIDYDNHQVVFTKIPSQYPETYEGCCEVLLLKPERATYSVSGLEYKRHLIVNLQRLLICRNAYWKIYGEKMRLGKHWEPDWNTKELKYIIYYENDKLWFNDEISRNTILAFPTEEVRDAFYENFKDLIESCNEFL